MAKAKLTSWQKLKGSKSKTWKPAARTVKQTLPSTFPCLFCDREDCITVRVNEPLRGHGSLECKNCGRRFQTVVNDLALAVDVYADWVDATEEAVAAATAQKHKNLTKVKARKVPMTLDELIKSESSRYSDDKTKGQMLIVGRIAKADESKAGEKLGEKTNEKTDAKAVARANAPVIAYGVAKERLAIGAVISAAAAAKKLKMPSTSTAQRVKKTEPRRAPAKKVMRCAQGHELAGNKAREIVCTRCMFG